MVSQQLERSNGKKGKYQSTPVYYASADSVRNRSKIDPNVGLFLRNNCRRIVALIQVIGTTGTISYVPGSNGCPQSRAKMLYHWVKAALFLCPRATPLRK